MTSPLRLRILGAGISGLAAASLLAADGHDVELIDERFSTPNVGTALVLFPPAQAVLAELGVLDQVRAFSAAPEAGTLRAADGRLLASIPAGDALLTSRSRLVETLQEHLPAAVTTSRRRVEDVRPLRDGADLLVGADGVHSLVRRSGWSGRTRAKSHGMTVLRGTTPSAPPEISETWGRGWLVGITPLAGVGTNWFACVPEHRTGARAEDLAHLRSVVGGHREEIDAVLEAAEPQRTLVHGLHTAPAVWPVREEVVLLGDAAHAMAPNLGHGANTALQDARSLAAALRSGTGRDGAERTRRALRLHALRRALPGQGWRLGSEAMLRAAMASRASGVRDLALSTSVGRLGLRPR